MCCTRGRRDRRAEQAARRRARPRVREQGRDRRASSQHAHCQIFATNFPFKVILDETNAAERHHRETGRVLFQDVIRTEIADGRRLLEENAAAVAFVPYFARWPYEVYVAPREPHESIVTLAPQERLEFGRALKGVLQRYERMWGIPFPYVMVLHQAPIDGRPHPSFHFHAEFHPPLRRPGLRKYLAGPEIGAGNFLNDTRLKLPPPSFKRLSPCTLVKELGAKILAIHRRIATQSSRPARRNRSRRSPPSRTTRTGRHDLRGRRDSGACSRRRLRRARRTGAPRARRRGTAGRQTRPGRRRGRPVADDRGRRPDRGTRGLMYQKRSAWILTGVVSTPNDEATLEDIELAVQTEIPLIKQHLSDELMAVRRRPPGLATQPTDR